MSNKVVQGGDHENIPLTTKSPAEKSIINIPESDTSKVNEKYAILPNSSSTNKNELSIKAINFYLDHLVKTKVISQV